MLKLNLIFNNFQRLHICKKCIIIELMWIFILEITNQVNGH